MNFKKIFKQSVKLTICAAFLGTSFNLFAALPVVGPFTTRDGYIIDKNNQPVTFKGVNWFGFNTGNYIVHGLWQSDFTVMLKQIKSLGFNAVRIPFQFDFVLNPSIKPNGINTSCNGPNSCNQNVPTDSALHAFQWVVEQFTTNGMYVLIDDHYEDTTYSTNPNGWLQGWKTLAQIFKNNPLVGYDLYNEPDAHSITWESTNNNNPAWGAAVMSAANAIYTIDPSKLIFVEGTAQGALEANWGNGFATDDQTVQQNISNPKNFFTQLTFQPYINQIVISPHMYGPDGTNGQGPDLTNLTHAFSVWSRTAGYLNNNFLNINNTNMSGFCLECGVCHIYPLALGEFGGKFDPNDPWYTQDTTTHINIAKFLGKLGEGKAAQPSWFYWDWNPNSGNTGGILKDDWKTFDCNKVKYLVQNLALMPDAGICV